MNKLLASLRKIVNTEKRSKSGKSWEGMIRGDTSLICQDSLNQLPPYFAQSEIHLRSQCDSLSQIEILSNENESDKKTQSQNRLSRESMYFKQFREILSSFENPVHLESEKECKQSHSDESNGKQMSSETKKYKNRYDEEEEGGGGEGNDVKSNQNIISYVKIPDYSEQLRSPPPQQAQEISPDWGSELASYNASNLNSSKRNTGDKQSHLEICAFRLAKGCFQKEQLDLSQKLNSQILLEINNDDGSENSWGNQADKRREVGLQFEQQSPIPSQQACDSSSEFLPSPTRIDFVERERNEALRASLEQYKNCAQYLQQQQHLQQQQQQRQQQLSHQGISKKLQFGTLNQPLVKPTLFSSNLQNIKAVNYSNQLSNQNILRKSTSPLNSNENNEDTQKLSPSSKQEFREYSIKAISSQQMCSKIVVPQRKGEQVKDKPQINQIVQHVKPYNSVQQLNIHQRSPLRDTSNNFILQQQPHQQQIDQQPFQKELRIKLQENMQGSPKRNCRREDEFKQDRQHSPLISKINTNQKLLQRGSISRSPIHTTPKNYYDCLKGGCSGKYGTSPMNQREYQNYDKIPSHKYANLFEQNIKSGKDENQNFYNITSPSTNITRISRNQGPLTTTTTTTTTTVTTSTTTTTTLPQTKPLDGIQYDPPFERINRSPVREAFLQEKNTQFNKLNANPISPVELQTTCSSSPISSSRGAMNSHLNWNNYEQEQSNEYDISKSLKRKAIKEGCEQLYANGLRMEQTIQNLHKSATQALPKGRDFSQVS